MSTFSHTQLCTYFCWKYYKGKLGDSKSFNSMGRRRQQQQHNLWALSTKGVKYANFIPNTWDRIALNLSFLLELA
jgi:hypothetical protein